MFGVVIVTYNSAAVIAECLEACSRIAGAEVVVVDNASTDGTDRLVEAHAGVRLIRHRENRGFAAAANRGISELTTGLVLLLNPDAAPAAGWVELAQAARQRGVGAASGNLVDDGGNQQHGFHVRGFPSAVTLCFEALGFNRLFAQNSVNRRYRLKLEGASVRYVDQPAGAFLMIRRDAWEQVGGFDEGFFPVWFEDVDFCLRLRQQGLRILYVPAAVARHHGGESVNQLQWGTRQVYWYTNLLRYANKHFSAMACRAVGLAVLAGISARVTIALLTRSAPDVASAYGKILQAVGRSLTGGERPDMVSPMFIQRSNRERRGTS